jgi:hypothetical protein
MIHESYESKLLKKLLVILENEKFPENKIPPDIIIWWNIENKKYIIKPNNITKLKSHERAYYNDWRNVSHLD